jgi:formate hydrogenlyase subunit 3/multisubunit Na+/H+ antiporter MnhD subunit
MRGLSSKQRHSRACVRIPAGAGLGAPPSPFLAQKPLSPLTPLLFLVVGAGGLLLGLLPRFRYTGLIAVAAALGATVALLFMALGLPVSATLSSWQPLDLLGTGLTLTVDGLAWLFGLGVLAVALSALVTGLARPGGQRVGTRFTMLLLTACGLISIFSDNLLTRVMAWAFLDLIYFLALLFLAEADGLAPQAVLNLAFNSIGTLLAVGAAMLISRTSPALLLSDAAQTSQSTLLITLAAVFRLGLFPLHLGLPTEINIRQGLGSLLRLVPAAVALETLSRLAVYGFDDSVRLWLTVFGVAAALLGAAQLWSVADPRRGMAYVIIAQSGVALLAGLWGGAQAALALAATAIAMLLGCALIFLSNGHDSQRPWGSLPSALGAAALLGLPLTVGFLGVGQLYSSLLAAGGWAWLLLALVLIAQSVLAAGLFYTVFWHGQPVVGEPALVAAYWGGLSLPAILLVATAVLGGVVAGALSLPEVGLLGFNGPLSLIALGLVAVTGVAGFALWRFQDVVRGGSSVVLGASLASLARLDWLYRVVWAVVRGTGNGIATLAAVLEGEGAILWALVAGALVWLLVRR